MILSLDVNSEQTGFAFGGPDDSVPRGGVWQLPGGKDLPRACAVLHSSVAGLAGLIHPKVIVIEAPLNRSDRFHSARSNLVTMALYGAALAAGSRAGAVCKDANVQTWRAHFLGKGKGNLPGEEAKAMAMHLCNKVFGWTSATHDEAEAKGIWAWAMATHYPKWSPKSTPLFGRQERTLSP